MKTSKIKKREVWVTADNKRIPINDMSVEHLRNTLSMIVRKVVKDKCKWSENIFIPGKLAFLPEDNDRLGLKKQIRSYQKKHNIFQNEQ